MRDGDWKLVRRHPDNWELHNMLEDRTELYDRASTETVRCDAMVAQYGEWAARCGVLDWPLRRSE